MRRFCTRCGMERSPTSEAGCSDHASVDECLEDRHAEVKALRGILDRIFSGLGGRLATLLHHEDYGVVWHLGKAWDPILFLRQRFLGSLK